MVLPLKSNLLSSTFTPTFSEEFTKKIGTLLNFFTVPNVTSQKIKNMAIFLNWYEVLSLLKITPVSYKSLKETFFNK